jgi:hypothetical protein
LTVKPHPVPIRSGIEVVAEVADLVGYLQCGSEVPVGA